MLQRLQRRFLAVTMTLLAVVMFGTLSVTYSSTQASLDRFVVASLDRVLDTSSPTRPLIGVLSDTTDTTASFGHMAVFWVDIDEETAEVTTNDSAAIIGPKALSAVLNAASTTDDEMGELPEYNIVWKRADLGDGVERIAIANTTGVEAALEDQFLISMSVGTGCLLILLAIMWYLSEWMITPVKNAWQAQRQFSADASHELKTPLAVVKANTDILRGHKDTIPAEDMRWIDSTAEEVERMQALVTDLLELSRADENSIVKGATYAMEDVNLSTVAEGMSLQFDVVAFEHENLIEEDIDPDIHVTGDERELGKLVKLLLDNAVKYSYKGETVTIGLHRQGGKAKLTVNNRGDVLSEEDCVRIFDRFYRSDKARARETGGYGLGLTIGRAIVEGHGGTIACTSSEADGTTFTVTLPAS
jgi:signal transduction histidine kinase